MKVYEVRKYTVFPYRCAIDQLIKRFDFIAEALDFSMEYNTQKMVNGFTGKVMKHKNKWGKMDYNYAHNGNDRYYVKEITTSL